MINLNRASTFVLLIGTLSQYAAIAQDQQNSDTDKARAPKIDSVTPPLGAVDVDPSISEVVIKFDMPMSPNGYSVVGDADRVPPLTAAPRWDDAHTCVLPVKLKANWEYRFSINSATFQNFRSVWLVPAEATSWHFQTGGASDVGRAPEKQRALNMKSYEALHEALATRYSYYDMSEVPWDELTDGYREHVEKAPDTQEWIKLVANMLMYMKDLHLTFEFEGVVTPTFTRRMPVGSHPDAIRKLIPNVESLNDHVAAGETDEGIVYLAVHTFDSSVGDQIQRAQEVLAKHKDAPGIILDVRRNAGGSESIAETIAAWFVSSPRVYAQHDFRRGRGPRAFSPRRDRMITPNNEDRRYTGPVVVLMGRGNVSSAEAFILMMKQADDTLLVGGKSFGSSGNPAPAYLPNGVKVMIPSWRAMTAKGRIIEKAGIEPHVPIDMDYNRIAEHDPVLEFAINHLRKKVQRKNGNP